MHDYVMLWNAVALELNRRDHTGNMNARNQRGPTASSRALAMVHVAMHDAYFGRTGVPLVPAHPDLAAAVPTFLNLGGLAAPAHSAQSEAEAVSAAARVVLCELYPDFKPFVDQSWEDLGIGPSAAVTFGEEVAKLVLADRDGDGHKEGNKKVDDIAGYWRHREDPTDLGQGLLGQNWGAVRFFSASAMPALDDHPVPRSGAYNDAHDQVRRRGNRIPENDPRTPARRLIGLYWAYDGASQIGTPPRLYNQIARQIIRDRVAPADRTAVSARLLALVNVAMADAGIASWYWKYVFQLWRPVLGIREYDNSFWQTGGVYSPALHLRADPWWEPFGAPRTNEPGRGSFTPPFPAYPSGHATFGAAAFEMLRLFFEVPADQPDNLAFDFVSDEMDGRAIADDGSFRGLHRRRYPSMLHAMFDNAVSRVYLGVHWRFDGLPASVTTPGEIVTDGSRVGGVPLGRSLAQDIFGSRMTRSGLSTQVQPKNIPAVP